MQARTPPPQANDNLRFLGILKPTCEALAKASARDIAGLLPELLSRIRVIGAVSRFYWTDERLAGLLRKVSNEVIRRCTADVDVAQASGAPLARLLRLARPPPSRAGL